MRIALYSSKRPRCGISTYTDYLAKAFVSLGHEVQYFRCQAPFEQNLAEILAWKPNVFHFQHEPSIMPPDDVAVSMAKKLRSNGAGVFLTLHTENRQTTASGIKICPNWKAIVVHRPSLMLDATVIAMPCPVADKKADKLALRLKYGLPPSAIILTTTGFLIPWKDHGEVVKHLLPWLRGRTDVMLQVIAAPHFNQDLAPYAQQTTASLAESARQIGRNRLAHISSYPSDDELLERIQLSDLGYVWCPMHTGSMSAAGALFSSARVPLVATDSTHYLYLGEGTIHAPKSSMPTFVKLIQQTVEDEAGRAKLAAEQEKVYQERNYRATAKQHIDLYEREKA